MVFVSENLKNMNFLTFMSVFMVFVSENLKNRNFVTFMDVNSNSCLLYGFLSEIEKQEFSHLDLHNR